MFSGGRTDTEGVVCACSGILFSHKKKEILSFTTEGWNLRALWVKSVRQRLFVKFEETRPNKAQAHSDRNRLLAAREGAEAGHNG